MSSGCRLIGEERCFVVVGLSAFGFVFAVISSLHSYLILACAGSKKAAEDVGFYYAANAASRLAGILCRGALTQYGGLTARLWGGGDAHSLSRAGVCSSGVEPRAMTVSPPAE
jgi:hypothetical protein